jgi:hypothetical protein
LDSGPDLAAADGHAQATNSTVITMTSPLNRERTSRLLTATLGLVDDYRQSSPADVVLAAVARAKIHVADGQRVLHDNLTDDEFVALVLDLARQELDLRLHRDRRDEARAKT